MKLLLIAANKTVVPYPVYPIGLDFISGALSSDHQIRMLDLCAIGENEGATSAIRAFDPEIIGISLRNIDNSDGAYSEAFYHEYRELMKLIRRCSNAPVIIGGSAFNIAPRLFMDALGADFGLVGEGERLSEVLNSLSTGKDPSTIPGLFTKRKDGDTPPYWKGKIGRNFNPDSSHVPFYLSRGGMLNLQTQRGCPFRCIYCTYPRIEGGHLRKFDPEKVAKEAIDLEKAGAKYMFVTDSSFNASHSHALEVAQAFKNAGLKIPWGAYFTPTKAPENFYEFLASCGLTHVEFGTDSLTDSVLKAFGKPFSAQDVFDNHRAAVGAGLFVAHYLILGGPGESAATVDQTLDRARELEKSVLFFFCGMRIYPNTPLFELALSEQIVSGREMGLEPVFYYPKDLARKDLIAKIRAAAKDRSDWVVGGGDEKMNQAIQRFHRRGRIGPLWEKLIR